VLRQALPLVHAVSTILSGKADPALMDAAVPTEEEARSELAMRTATGPTPTEDDLLFPPDAT
jgi:hypothetical protein